jgi:hypothetical protein
MKHRPLIDKSLGQATRNGRSQKRLRQHNSPKGFSVVEELYPNPGTEYVIAVSGEAQFAEPLGNSMLCALYIPCSALAKDDCTLVRPTNECDSANRTLNTGRCNIQTNHCDSSKPPLNVVHSIKSPEICNFRPTLRAPRLSPVIYHVNADRESRPVALVMSSPTLQMGAVSSFLVPLRCDQLSPPS